MGFLRAFKWITWKRIAIFVVLSLCLQSVINMLKFESLHMLMHSIDNLLFYSFGILTGMGLLFELDRRRFPTKLYRIRRKYD